MTMLWLYYFFYPFVVVITSNFDLFYHYCYFNLRLAEYFFSWYKYGYLRDLDRKEKLYGQISVTFS